MNVLRLALLVNQLINNFQVLIDTIEITPNNMEAFQRVTNRLQELNEFCKPV